MAWMVERAPGVIRLVKNAGAKSYDHADLVRFPAVGRHQVGLGQDICRRPLGGREVTGE